CKNFYWLAAKPVMHQFLLSELGKMPELITQLSPLVLTMKTREEEMRMVLLATTVAGRKVLRQFFAQNEKAKQLADLKTCGALFQTDWMKILRLTGANDLIVSYVNLNPSMIDAMPVEIAALIVVCFKGTSLRTPILERSLKKGIAGTLFAFQAATSKTLSLSVE